jgi:hypothetical protein
MSSDYGTYRLTYTPPNDPDPHYPLISIDMSTSGDANVDQMLRFFEAFLAASGYVLNGELQVVEPERNPWERLTIQGSPGIDFIPFDSYLGNNVIYSAQGTDTISFGAAQSVECGAKTWDDVISFG